MYIYTRPHAADGKNFHSGRFMGGKIEKSWSVTAGGDEARGFDDVHFNIICKSCDVTAASCGPLYQERTPNSYRLE